MNLYQLQIWGHKSIWKLDLNTISILFASRYQNGKKILSYFFLYLIGGNVPKIFYKSYQLRIKFVIKNNYRFPITNSVSLKINSSPYINENRYIISPPPSDTVVYTDQNDSKDDGLFRILFLSGLYRFYLNSITGGDIILSHWRCNLFVYNLTILLKSFFVYH